MVGEIKLIASADGAEQTIQLKPGAKFPVQPNTNYKVVVDGQAALPPGTKIVRQGNNLVIKFADGEIVELTDWANTLNSNLVELNGAQAYATDTANFVEVTEIESGPGGLAGAQGQGLGSLGEADITSAAATPASSGAPAAGAAAMSPGAIAGIVLGVAAVGAAGGGGGGGGGSGPSQPANPAAPTLGLDDNSNTGSKTDSITSVDLPVISGTAPAGATVSVTLPGETLQAVADQSGNWSVTTTRPLPEGDTQISAIASQGGRDSSAAQLTVTVDKTVPAAPTNAPDLTETSDKGISATDNLTSEASPAFSGTGGPAGETVVLIVDENAVGTATINADGTFIVSPDQPLTEGAHEVAFAFRDAAGNQSTAGTQTLVVNLDLTPPTGSPGATPDMATASDSAGSSNTDNITSNRQPVFNGTGTGAPGAALALLANGVQVGSTVVAPNGSYSVTPSAPLADGAYSMTVAFTDDAGNVSTPSAPLSVVIDTVAPIAQAPGLAAASDSGNSGDNRTNDTTPTLQGTGVPGDIVTVDFPVVGGETVKATVNANGIWTATPVAALAQGANTINLSAVDPAGNAGPNSTYNVTIDTVAPNAPAITAVAENAGGGINATEAADGTLVSINLAGTGALAGDRVLVNWRGQEAAYVLTGADITATKAEALVSASVLQLAGNGTFNISALVEDQAGNRSGTSVTFANVTVNGVPPPAPNAQLSSSSDSGTVGDNRTNDTTPTITGTAIVDTKFFTVTTPKGEVLNSGPVGGGGSWSLTATTPLDEGNNNLQITASDTVGNVSSPTTLALVIDSKAPAAPTVTPNMIDSSDSGALNADNLTSVVRPTFNAPSGSATSGDVVSLIVDGSERATATVLANGGFSLTPTSDLSEDDHTVTYRISDAAGNVSGVSPELQIAVDKTAPAAPVISSVPENDNGGINPTERADGTVVNVGLAGTDVKAGDLLTLSWGAQTVTYTIAADDVSSKSAAVNVLASTINTQGINTNVDVRAKLTDVAGNVGELSAPLQVSVDSTGAGKPTVTVPESSNSTPGINLAEASDGTTVNVGLSGTGAIAGDAVVVNWGSQAVNYTLVQGDINAGTAAITVPSGAITTGNVSVTAVINDQPGNAGTASDALAVTVDLVAPSAPVISNASNITSPTPTVIGIAGTAEPGATVQLFDTDGVTLLGSGSADGAGGWSITSSALSAGDHTIKAKQTDTAGNISPLSVSGILVSVAGAPTATAAESRPLQLHDLLSDDGATNLAAASSLSLPSSHTSLSSLLDEQPIAPSL